MEAVRTFQQSLQSKGSGDYRVYKVVDSPLSVLTTSDERIAIAVTMTHGLENWTQVEPYAHMDFQPWWGQGCSGRGWDTQQFSGTQRTGCGWGPERFYRR